MPDARATAKEAVDGRTVRWDEHKAQRRDLILTAAVQAVRDSGGQVGVQEIAERAGLPRSVVYRLFEDRKDLDEQLRVRILNDLMAQLAPTLTPHGTLPEAIGRSVDAYVGWIVANPRLHQFLGSGSASNPTRGSRVVYGTRTAIAVQVMGLFENLLRTRTEHVEIAEPLAFGLVGLVDASVNRWLNKSSNKVSPQQLSEFLRVSIWQVLDGNLRTLGIELDPDTQVAELL
ncbi:TetR/AcrR family transcriptional regulator [Skermania sp. ID1734]|uniref:TetR/AcrR family transcriptional regulator n=1 Tax=Skermania sp. ID1734 TaxID=2597516 RepID=UPI00117D82B6|nr:TetR/AcrR family transcriptional regulator [Skermania sp. ID1734]TSE01453.1 TetR/AcrR family transcriptional regulator [Skermania sp. ID1734]